MILIDGFPHFMPEDGERGRLTPVWAIVLLLLVGPAIPLVAWFLLT